MIFEFWPDKKGWLLNFVSTKGGNFEFWPSYIIKIINFPLFIGSFDKRSCSLRSQTFLSFSTLHLAYLKLVGTPCTAISQEKLENEKLIKFVKTRHFFIFGLLSEYLLLCLCLEVIKLGVLRRHTGELWGFARCLAVVMWELFFSQLAEWLT